MFMMRRWIAIVALAAGLLGQADLVRADPLDDAKLKGQIGERIDGYVGARATSKDVLDLVNEINAERSARYAKIAESRNAPVEAVAQIAGQKLIDRAKPGEYVMGADGQWRQK